MRKSLLVTVPIASFIVAANLTSLPADAAPPLPKIQSVQRGLFIGQDATVQRSSQYTVDMWRVIVYNTSAAMSIDIEANVMCARITF